jgi:hypothetical protein
MEGRCWRAVEAQHHVSTAKLTDTLADQRRLEDLIERSKPIMPEDCRHLDFLLSTPFRYGSVYPHGSRFRRAGATMGVFYAAELPATAVAELAFYRLLFFAESPDTPWPTNPGEYTTFAVEYKTSRAIDLQSEPFRQHRAIWTHPTDYSNCQALADAARAGQIEVIKYESARAADAACNLALLCCGVFAKPEEVARQTWRIHLSSFGARTFCEWPKISFGFGRAAFDRDPRIAAMKWDR